MQLVLVPESLKDPSPAAFREAEAAKYVCLGIHRFREMVNEGHIVCRVRGRQRIYLKADLDDYLAALPVETKDAKITPPLTLLKGNS